MTLKGIKIQISLLIALIFFLETILPLKVLSHSYPQDQYYSLTMQNPSNKPQNHNKTRLTENTSQAQVPFIANSGQINNRSVKYYASTFGGKVFVTTQGELVYSLPKMEKTNVSADKPAKTSPNNNPYNIIKNMSSKIKGGWVLKETLIGARKAKPRGTNGSATKVNYITGRDTKKWHSDIATFNSLSLGEMYPGITYNLRAHGNNVEKVFTVNPGADAKQIRIRMQGAKYLKVNDNGELEAGTGYGPVRFTKPVAYQEMNGKKVYIRVSYNVTRNSYGFILGNYDKNRPLVIDPLLASTFIGGTNDDKALTSTTDNEGNVYVSGATFSSDYPTTVGAYDSTKESPLSDVFISKFNPSLNSLLVSTYIGGSDVDSSSSVTIDSGGNVYVAGATHSSDYPTTSGAFDRTYNGGDDIFITKLNANLNTVLASTFVGGNIYDDAYSITIDSTGNVFVAGYSTSSDYPTTPSAYSRTINSSYADIVVSKLDRNLSSLLASTYLGGVGADYAYSLSTDNSGNLLLAGSSYSWNFPTTSGSWDNSSNGREDAFVSKLDGNLSFLLASTYLGGDDDDRISSLTSDSTGNIYVAGHTWSMLFPTTPGCYDNTFHGARDGFIAKLSGSLGLLSSTYIGGVGWDEISSITRDSAGNLYITGETGSFDYPTTPGSYDSSFNGIYDVFISKVAPNLSSLDASTFIGGGGHERAESINIDNTGHIIVTGLTFSSDYPTTSGAYDPTFNGIGGKSDLFVSKLTGDLSGEIVPPPPPPEDPAVLPPVEVTGPQVQETAKEVTYKADKVEELSDGKFKYSGNVRINDFLKLDGTLIVDKENLEMTGNGRLYIETTLPHYYGTINIYNGEFSINADAAEILKATGADELTVAGLTVKIERLRLLTNGVSIAGSLNLPQNVGGGGVQIEDLQLVDGQVNIAGEISLPEISVGKSRMKLCGGSMSFDTANNIFEGHASLEIPNIIGIEGSVGFQNARLNKVGFGLSGLNLAIDGSGFFLQRLYGEVSGLSVPPLAITGVADINGGPEIFGIAAIAGQDLTLTVSMDGSISGSGTLRLVDAYNLASANFVINFGRSFGVTAELNALDIIIASAYIKVEKTGEIINFCGSGNTRLQVPSQVPMVGGKTLMEAGLSIDNSGLKGIYQYGMAEFGYMMDWQKNWEFNININVFNSQQAMAYRFLDVQPLNMLTIPEGAEQVLVRLTWESGDTDFSLTSPVGNEITPLNAPTDSTVANYFKNPEKNEAYYILGSPQGGAWLYNLTNGSPGIHNVEVMTIEVPPTLNVTSPSQDIAASGPVNITWETDSPTGKIDLYYDQKGQGNVGNLIVSGIDASLGSYSWNCENIPSGAYHIFARLEKGTNPPVFAYAPGKVTIVNPETPAVPSGLTTRAVNGNLELSWAANTESDLAGYKLQLLDEPGKVATVAKETSFIWTGLATDRIYKVALSSYNEQGMESALSNPVEVYLPTPAPPEVSVNWPLTDVTNYSKIDVAGTIEEGATGVLYRNDEPIATGLTGSFNQEVELLSGDNNLTLVASKPNGDAAEESKDYHFDQTPPQLTVDNLTPLMHVTTPNLIISGTAEPAALLTLNGSPLNIHQDSRYEEIITLKSGPNKMDIVVSDDAGNRTQFNGTVYYDDAAPPAIIINTPEDNSSTNNNSLLLTGITEAESTVEVNGTGIVIDSQGNFAATVNLTAGTNTITVKATDTEGLSSMITRNVLYDINAPSVNSIITPAFSNSATFSVSLSATDPSPGSGVDSFDIQWKEGGSGWTNWKTGVTSNNASFTGTNGKTYYFRALARDKAGNTGNWTTAIYKTLVDTALPRGSIKINNGGIATNKTGITLNLSAIDLAPGSGIAYMMISNASNFAGAAWVTYATSKSWTLPSSDGVKRVYIKYKDKAGNISTTLSDTIILDRKRPTGRITINKGSSRTRSRNIILKISASDPSPASGIVQMIISNNSNFSGATWVPYTTSKSWILPSLDGTKRVYIRFKDKAGNISLVYSDSIVLDT